MQKGSKIYQKKHQLPQNWLQRQFSSFVQLKILKTCHPKNEQNVAEFIRQITLFQQFIIAWYTLEKKNFMGKMIQW